MITIRIRAIELIGRGGSRAGCTAVHGTLENALAGAFEQTGTKAPCTRIVGPMMILLERSGCGSWQEVQLGNRLV
jgi:hypothetical protein